MLNLSSGLPSSLRLGDDPPAPSGGETTDAQLAALIKHLPELTRVTGDNILPFEQARINASKVISPQENALAAKLYAQYGPILNRIGSEIAGQNQLAAVRNDAAALNQAQQSGLIDQALALQRQSDPEFFAMRAKLADKNSKLLDSMGDGGLSPTEIEEIARLTNRSNVAAGVNDVGSPTAAVRNALQFGSAGQAKRNSLAQALATTAQSLSSTRSGFDPFQVATGRSAFAGNTGENKYQANNAQNLGQGTLSLSNNLLQQTGENARQSNQLNSQRRSGLDVFNQTFGNIMGGASAFAGGISRI